MGEAKRREETLLSDEEIRRKMMADPEIRARIEAALRKKPEGTGITAEELPDFLRDA
jgi:hypothetical protein